MPTLFQKFKQTVLFYPEWHYSIHETIMGYRSYQEMLEEYMQVLDEGMRATMYYKSIGNEVRALTLKETKQAMTVYIRAANPRLNFLIIGRKTKYGVSTPVFPHIDKILRKNMRKISESYHKRGSIMHSKKWNYLMNDLFVMGGIANQQPFYLASMRTRRNLWNTTGKHTTIFARELIALFAVGYELQRLQDGSEAMVPPCEGSRFMDLRSYQILRNQFREADSVAYIAHPRIKRFAFDPDSLDFHPELYPAFSAAE